MEHTEINDDQLRQHVIAETPWIPFFRTWRAPSFAHSKLWDLSVRLSDGRYGEIIAVRVEEYDTRLDIHHRLKRIANGTITLETLGPGSSSFLTELPLDRFVPIYEKMQRATIPPLGLKEACGLDGVCYGFVFERGMSSSIVMTWRCETQDEWRGFTDAVLELQQLCGESVKAAKRIAVKNSRQVAD